MSKLSDMANGFRPKEKPVYEAEPVNLGPPPPTHFGDFNFNSTPRDVVKDYRRRIGLPVGDRRFYARRKP